jgi:hypothetical protein
MSGHDRGVQRLDPDDVHDPGHREGRTCSCFQRVIRHSMPVVQRALSAHIYLTR